MLLADLSLLVTSTTSMPRAVLLFIEILAEAVSKASVFLLFLARRVSCPGASGIGQVAVGRDELKGFGVWGELDFHLGVVYLANCHLSSDWQFKQPVILIIGKRRVALKPVFETLHALPEVFNRRFLSYFPSVTQEVHRTLVGEHRNASRKDMIW